MFTSEATQEDFDGGGQFLTGTRVNRAPAIESIDAVRQIHRMRDFALRSAGDETRRIRSACMIAARFDPSADAKSMAAAKKLADAAYKSIDAGKPEGIALMVAPIVEGTMRRRDDALSDVKAAEKRAKAVLKEWHVAKFVEETCGFGWVGLLQIIGEAGDLGAYSNPAKLWKRMGLGLISTGERQRKFTDVAKALEAGYSPKRRSLMYVIGDSMIKTQGPYRELYLTRKAYEQAKLPDGTAMVWHRRAQRYMEKRLLRNLWRAWRGMPAGINAAEDERDVA
jgi:hypothetical protein